MYRTKLRRKLVQRPGRAALARLAAAAAVAGALALAAPLDAHARKPRHGHQDAICGPPPSADIDAPTPLPSTTISGCGAGKAVSYYYKLAADAGTITLTATGSNRPSGFASALQAVLLTTKAEPLCSLSLGNATKRTTATETCASPAQELILRLNLDPESLSYRVSLNGPIRLPGGAGSAAPGGKGLAAAAGEPVTPPSSDIDAPTPFVGPTIKGKGINKATSYYYSLTVAPGDVTLTADAKNRPAGSTQALKVTLQDLRATELCSTNIGNSTRDARSVVTCPVPAGQRAILRVDLSEETIDWRVRVEGALAPR